MNLLPKKNQTPLEDASEAARLRPYLHGAAIMKARDPL